MLDSVDSLALEDSQYGVWGLQAISTLTFHRRSDQTESLHRLRSFVGPWEAFPVEDLG